MKKLQFTIKKSLSEVERVRVELEQFYVDNGLKDKAIYELELILEELLSNIINYGFVDRKFQPIILNVGLNNKNVVLSVKDKGKPFNPLELEDPDVSGSVKDRKIGGLGIFMLKKLSDNVKYEYKQKSNVTTILKKIR
ncbi:MAG: ATP-binding protein [Bacteroidota bacterium]